MRLMHATPRLQLSPLIQHLVTSYVRFTPLILYLSKVMKPIVLTIVDSEDLILETDPKKQLALTGMYE
jgi:hypothetical protein